MKDSRTLPRAFQTLGLTLIFATLCGWPYYRWSSHPSLFDDDFLRVGSLRQSTLVEALFRPFNEHMAPLFETVSWLAWQGAGRRVEAVPTAFLVASYLGFGLTVATLGAWVRFELRSTTAALGAVALLTLSSVSAEVVLWYSASSFSWAAWMMLATILTSAVAARSPSKVQVRFWLAVSALFSLGSPSFSAIGILAGPLGMLRFLLGNGPRRSVTSRLGGSLVPMLGTGLYLLICERFGYHELLSQSVQRNTSPIAAVWASIRAPSAVLIPGLVGCPNLVWSVPGFVLGSLSLVGLVVALNRAIRSPQRPILLVGLAMIVGGYVSTYLTRARPGDPSVLDIQRYHLIPQLGLMTLLATFLARLTGQVDRDVRTSLMTAIGVAAVLALVQYPRMQAVSDQAFRYPEQRRALVATVRLETVCEREGITLSQAMTALEPIQPRWYPRPWPFNPLLHLFGKGPSVSRVPDSLVRTTLLANLSIEDRESLFGGMEATRYRMPASAFESRQPASIARLVGRERMSRIGDGTYQVEGQPAFLEFEVGLEADSARAICLPSLRTRRDLEIWWLGEDGTWSALRSARWKPEPQPSTEDGAVPIDLLPHWRRGSVRRLRLVFREWGQVAIQPPRFLP